MGTKKVIVKYTTMETIDQLGVADESLTKILCLVSKVREKANELGGKGKVKFSFKSKAPMKESIAEVEDVLSKKETVVFWKV